MEEMKMKKLLTGILTTAIVLSIGTTSALAAGSGRGQCGTKSASKNYAETACRYYTDADGDGICDNCGTAVTGNGNGNRNNYVDADGDGVCDNAGSGAKHGCGQGNGAQRGCRK